MGPSHPQQAQQTLKGNGKNGGNNLTTEMQKCISCAFIEEIFLEMYLNKEIFLGKR